MSFFGSSFSAADIPDLKGKVAIVTGANAGIGKASTLELARSVHIIIIIFFLLRILSSIFFDLNLLHSGMVLM